jgi:hypothetical protein
VVKSAAKVRYEAVIEHELAEHSIRVRKWRRSMSGMAWQLRMSDGSVRRLLESPRPKSPMSCAIFLHEVGHHAIGFDRYKPRCLEEYHAWRWSLVAMARHGVPVTPEVEDRVVRSLRYAVGKALRRGLKALPLELAAFVPPVRGAGDDRGPALRAVAAMVYVHAGEGLEGPACAATVSSPG